MDFSKIKNCVQPGYLPIYRGLNVQDNRYITRIIYPILDDSICRIYIEKLGTNGQYYILSHNFVEHTYTIRYYADDNIREHNIEILNKLFRAEYLKILARTY